MSTRYSSSPSEVSIGPGCANSCEGKRVASFGLCALSSDTWKVGNWLVGMSRVYVETSRWVAVTRYGPSHQGKNLAMRFSPFFLYLCHLFAVDNMTRSSTWKCGSGAWDFNV